MRLRFKKGFVITEVLLATIITAFAICGLLLMYITAMDLIRTSKNVNIATNAAQGVIEEIRNTPFLCLAETSCCAGAFCPAKPECINSYCYNGLNFTVNSIPSSVGVVNVDDTDPELLKITVRVSWPQGNRAVDPYVELVTQVTRR